MDALPITLFISTRNAAPLLAGCIESAREWVNEIVVVDMESSDDTLEIARSYGATVVQVPAAGYSEPGRQAGIDAATQPWILVLDADERAGRGLAELARGFIERDEVAGVRLARQNFQFGWWLPGSGIWPDWQLRLFKRESTTWSVTRIHVGPSVDGTVADAPLEIDSAIVHHSFPSVSAWMSVANKYTDLEAQRMDETGQKPTVARLIGVPTARFVDSYVRRRGFRGGRYGLAVALMSFCYSMLAELKRWEQTLAGKPPTRNAVREPEA